MGTQSPIVINYTIPQISGNDKGQHIWSAMDEPHPGKNTFVIIVSPLLGKILSCFFR